MHAPRRAVMLRAMFKFLLPRWKKEAKLLHKGGKKFIHYKRDLLEPDRIDEIESRRADLLAAVKRGDRDAAEEAGKQLRATCEQALPRIPQQTWWEENVEVLFVALVVALGIRAYLLQPFRIPTGSMQPTLNGIIAVNHGPGEEFKRPWFGQRAAEWVLRGRSYRNIVAESDMSILPGRQGIRDASFFLFTRTKLHFDNGQVVTVPAAAGEAQRLVYHEHDGDGDGRPDRRRFAKGDSVLRGWLDSGDLVLVDKVSYHFRRPRRGEVFVFDTRAIPTDGTVSGAMAGQSGGTHYIKRLCGVPGDALSIETPNLLNHGRILQEAGIQRVIRREGPYGEDPDGTVRPGYVLADPRQLQRFPFAPLAREGAEFTLAAEAAPGLREYAALGDNTENSLDSRYWGTVHEFNLAGPALLSLWPFTSGHWGFIR